MNDKRKMTAAVAAVFHHIQTEEEAAAMRGPAFTGPAAPEPVVFPSQWAAAGRQSLMQMRSLMQMKALHGFKLR